MSARIKIKPPKVRALLTKVRKGAEDLMRVEMKIQLEDARRLTPVKSGLSRRSWRGRIEPFARGRIAIALTNDAPGARYIEAGARGELRKGRFKRAPNGIIKPVAKLAEQRMRRTLKRLLKGV